MSAPIIFYMFLNSFAPIVVSDYFMTTLIFEERIIDFHSGMDSREFFVKKSKNPNRIHTLFLKAKGVSLNTNLSVTTESGKLYSFLIKTGDKPHSIIQIKDGKKTNLLKDVKNIKGVIIQEGAAYAQLLNGSKKSIMVNSQMVNPGARFELPKGPPIYIDGKRQYK